VSTQRYDAQVLTFFESPESHEHWIDLFAATGGRAEQVAVRDTAGSNAPASSSDGRRP
jgi:hypothetical protein